MPNTLRVAVVVAMTLSLLLGSSCAPTSSVPSNERTVDTGAATSSTTSTLPISTTTEPRSGFRFYKVDPSTLQPLPGFDPIHTGDTLGLASPNGRWLVLESWGEGRWLIDTESWEVASDFRPWGGLMEVRDDGTVYAADWDPVLEIRRFLPGAEDWEDVGMTLESDPNLWSNPIFLHDHRLAARGFSEGIYVDDGDLTVNVIDITTGFWRQMPVPGAWTPGEPTGMFIDGYEITRYDDPAVVFTQEKAFVVHAHEDVVTEVDLSTGEVMGHQFGPKTSLLESLSAWFAPRAMAKGPAPGVRRTAVISHNGSKLYLSGYHTEVVDEDGQVRETTVPLGVQVIDTRSWQVEETLDLPVGTLHLSPDGSMLLAAGYDESEVFAISTDTYQVTRFDKAGHEWSTTIEFSADGSYAYLSHEFRIEVLDLQRLEIVAETRSTRSLHVWGPAAVVSEWLGE
jgi:hypothetical protein